MATYDHDTIELVYSIPTYEIPSNAHLKDNKFIASILQSIPSLIGGFAVRGVSTLLGLSAIGGFFLCWLLPIFLLYL